MSAPLYLGVDGGGSRCRARLENAEGETLGRGLAGPASMRFGLEATTAEIMTSVRQAFAEASLPESALAQTFAGIGLAGTGHRGARAALESWRHPFAGAWFEGDGYLAMLGAFDGGEGGVVIAGTGSIGVTYHEKLVRVGGYGFPVSDEGSGADIGLNALRHTLRTLDGRAAPSAFSRAMMARFADDPAEVTAWMDEATATDYATLAPIVVEHASAGDAVARRLMQEAAAQIAQIVEALFAKGAPRIALIGGVAEPLKAYMPPALVARLSEPKADATAGGILLAKRKSSAT